MDFLPPLSLEDSYGYGAEAVHFGAQELVRKATCWDVSNNLKP